MGNTPGVLRHRRRIKTRPRVSGGGREAVGQSLIVWLVWAALDVRALHPCIPEFGIFLRIQAGIQRIRGGRG